MEHNEASLLYLLIVFGIEKYMGNLIVSLLNYSRCLSYKYGCLDNKLFSTGFETA